MIYDHCFYQHIADWFEYNEQEKQHDYFDPENIYNLPSIQQSIEEDRK